MKEVTNEMKFANELLLTKMIECLDEGGLYMLPSGFAIYKKRNNKFVTDVHGLKFVSSLVSLEYFEKKFELE